MKRLAIVSFAFVVVGCSSGSPNFGQSASSSSSDLSGCHGVASSSEPADGDYYLTSFGFSPSDNGEMSCGEYTKDGSWYYAASRQRFGCGAHIQIEANGKCVVAETDDYGPDECVEAAAGKPIIDASPLVSEALFGTQSAGWSDRYPIHVTVVDTSTPLGACGANNTPPPPTNDGGTNSNAACSSSTLDEDVSDGTCVQSSSDEDWYTCENGDWVSGQNGCSASYAWCDSSTLGAWVPPRTCVQSKSDGVWYQCAEAGWESGVSNGSGPLGACASEHPLE
jgi:hypothetical protein